MEGLIEGFIDGTTVLGKVEEGFEVTILEGFDVGDVDGDEVNGTDNGW